MDDKTLIKWLNWFYTLEMSQVNLYLNQAKKTNDDYIAHVLLKVAEIEAKHAEMFYNFIRKLGSKPFKLDSLISKIIGHVPGQITPITGTVNLFLYNYTLETIAIADYKKLLSDMEIKSNIHQELAEVLMNNMIEEDFHRLWFKDRRESLKELKK